MILIADDNAIMRRMIRALIDDLDPDVVECADGAAAVELYEAHRPAWVLMDFSMRPTDGLTATRRAGTLSRRARPRSSARTICSPCGRSSAIGRSDEQQNHFRGRRRRPEAAAANKGKNR